MSGRHISNLRKIFFKSVNSVRPEALFTEGQWLRRLPSTLEGDRLQIYDQIVNLNGKKCHVVGFGKAVLGIAVQLERILGDRLVSGILSIPIGTHDKFKGVFDMTPLRSSKIKIYDGAKDNLPDEIAMQAAIKIKALAECLTQEDVLFVLISGGGSALLTLPIEPMTLKQKSNLIRNLAQRGADIEELNIVRISMSQVKGGKLAQFAKNAYRIYSFVISDIVNDPLHLIASGPTVEFKSDGRTAMNILQKYGLWDNLPAEIKHVAMKMYNESRQVSLKAENYVYIIGSNKIATNAALECARDLGYKSCIISTSVVGLLDDIEKIYTDLLRNLHEYLKRNMVEERFCSAYPFDKVNLRNLLEMLRHIKPGDWICLILAGEPTVVVKGSGVGGRNQELALRMSKAFYQNESLHGAGFLSAGTDGIDGPTNAAGAIGSAEIVERFLKFAEMAKLDEYLDNNDSYNFYRNVEMKDIHVVVGHTGTNVMDIHIMVFPVP